MTKTLEQILSEAKVAITCFTTDLQAIFNDLSAQQGYNANLYFLNGYFHYENFPLTDVDIVCCANYVCQYSDQCGNVYTVTSHSSSIKGLIIQ